MPAMMPPEAMPMQSGAGGPPSAKGGMGGGMPPEGEAAPMQAPAPPPQGYSKKKVVGLNDALHKALDAVGKATKAQMPQLQDKVPDEMFEGGYFKQPIPAAVLDLVVKLLAVANDIGGKMEGRYAVDVMSMLADDAGLEKLAVLLELIARDKVLLGRMKEAQKAAGKAPAPAAKKPEIEEVEEEETEETEAPAAGPSSPKDYM